MLNPWADPVVGDDEAVKYVLATGSLYGSPARVRDQVAELRDAGVRHLLCQTGFGDMSHQQNLASMRRFGEEVMPALDQADRAGLGVGPNKFRRAYQKPCNRRGGPGSEPGAFLFQKIGGA